MTIDELTLRPAQAEDRPAMERICAQTWEGGDYLPQVWDAWLADPEGAVVVGELEGTVVALSKITFQTRDQVWLEGMRVDPEYRHRGIAGRFLEYSLAYAREHGARVARLATGGYNTPVHRVTAHAGMERVGAYVFWIAEPLPGSPQPPVLSPADAGPVASLLDRSPVLDLCHGLYGVDWAWQELSEGRVAQLLGNGPALGPGALRKSPLGKEQIRGQRGSDGGLEALAVIYADPDGKDLWLGFVDGGPDQKVVERAAAVTALATGIRSCAAEAGFERVRAPIPDLAWLREAYQAAGYGIGDWDDELWIYERRFSLAGTE